MTKLSRSEAMFAFETGQHCFKQSLADSTDMATNILGSVY